MTTMELNLRKEYLYDLIKGMDEERLSKVETYIKTFVLSYFQKGNELPLDAIGRRIRIYDSLI